MLSTHYVIHSFYSLQWSCCVFPLSPQDLSGWSVCSWPKQWGPQRSSSQVTRAVYEHPSRLKRLVQILSRLLFSDPPLLHSDLFPERLTMAKELGADFQLTVKKGDGAQQLAKSVEDLLGAQPHITIECTGVESCVQTAIYVWVFLPVKYHIRDIMYFLVHTYLTALATCYITD